MRKTTSRAVRVAQWVFEEVAIVVVAALAFAVRPPEVPFNGVLLALLTCTFVAGYCVPPNWLGNLLDRVSRRRRRGVRNK